MALDSFDDRWDSIAAEMAAWEPEMPVGAVVDVSILTETQLIDRLDETVQELLDRGEALSPKTDTGRDLHSIRSSCLVELARRGLR